MPRKRPDGEGTLFYDEARKRWRGRLPADESGKRPWFSGKTQAEALEAKRTLESERTKGLQAKAPTVESFGSDWLEIIKRHRKAKTAQSYGEMLRQHITPTFGAMSLKKVTPRLVQKWVDTLSDKYSPHTVRNAYLRLHAIFELAVRDRLVEFNPCKDIELPKLQSDNLHSLSADHVSTLLKYVDTHRQGVLVYIYVCLGLRKGEGLGLKWSDVDWEKKTITLKRQVQEQKKTETQARVRIVEYTKTDASLRTLPLTEKLYEKLKAHQANQLEEQLLTGWKDQGLIFPTSNGTPMSPSNFWKMFQSILRFAELPKMRVHDLRRTTASLLTQAGVQEVVIEAILGHAPGSMTRHYIDVSVELMREAVEKVEDML
jgi:integrase